jgi:23S rRNA G2445 N2-methylase RlmL
MFTISRPTMGIHRGNHRFCALARLRFSKNVTRLLARKIDNRVLRQVLSSARIAVRMKNGRKLLKSAQKKKSQKKSAAVKTAPKHKRTQRVKEEAPAYRVDLSDFVTLEAAAAATGKTTYNIRDYIQRGRIAKFNPLGKRIARAANGELRVSLKEVRAFLSLVDKREERHHHAGLHPELGFYDVPERERTKHVHRLHPYLGKFIPQLVEWFLRRYFKEGDSILDPFMGSGTALTM